MKITKGQLRRIIREEVRRINEMEIDPLDPGVAKGELISRMTDILEAGEDETKKKEAWAEIYVHVTDPEEQASLREILSMHIHRLRSGVEVRPIAIDIVNAFYKSLPRYK